MDAIFPDLSDSSAAASTFVRVPPAVLADVGRRIAQESVLLQREGEMSPAALERLRALEQLGLELQSLVRAMRHTGDERGEALDLLSALHRLHGEWLNELARRGVRMTVGGQSALLRIDPALLQQLLGLLIEHGIAGGNDFTLTARGAAPPLPVQLLLGWDEGPGAPSDELHGQLLRLLASAHGWLLVRDDAGRATLRLQFERGLPAAEEGGLPRLQLPTEARVLVIDPHESSRVQSARLLREAGVQADCVATIEQAHDALRDGVPQLIVTGIAVDDPSAQALFAELREHHPRLRFIELVDQEFAFETSTPGGATPARLARQDLAHTLVTAVAQELSMGA